MKDKLEPINIRINLKRFLYHMKQKLRDITGTFWADTGTLLYYLEDSSKFQTDYSKYLESKNE